MRLRRLPAAIAIAALISCGGSDSTPSTPPAATVSRVTVTGSATTLMVGQSATLQAAAFSSSGAQLANPGTATWTSDAASVATVDQLGKVTAVRAGVATIAATIANVQGTAAITVNAPAPASKDTIVSLPAAWSPPSLIISVGGTVIFSFGQGIVHNAIFSKFGVPGAPIDIPNGKDQNYARTFNTKGKFPFECTIHSGMVGEITVQ